MSTKVEIRLVQFLKLDQSERLCDEQGRPAGTYLPICSSRMILVLFMHGIDVHHKTSIKKLTRFVLSIWLTMGDFLCIVIMQEKASFGTHMP